MVECRIQQNHQAESQTRKILLKMVNEKPCDINNFRKEGNFSARRQDAKKLSIMANQSNTS